MVNTAIYTRISQDTAGTGLGVARQEEACRAKAKVLGWNVVEVYTDNDISASKDKARPAYDRLLADIANGTVDGLVVYDLDRLTRKPAELESFIDLADKHSIKLANVSGDVDLSNANGRMIARIKGAVARQEAERIGERVKAQRQQAAAMGKPAGSRYRTFGYDKDWNVIEAEAKIVREMFKRYVAGNSVYSIKQYVSKQLNNINPVTGKEVIYSTVAGMLKNPRYAGYSVLNGQIVGEATYPAIIDKATFNAAADIWNATPLRKPKGFNARKYLLGGLVYCGKCNARMSGQKNNRGVAYYQCRPTNNGCAGVSFKAQWLDDAIIREVAGHLRTPAKDKPVDYTDQIRAQETVVAELRSAYAKGQITMGDFLPMLNEANKVLSDLQAKAAVVTKATAAGRFPYFKNYKGLVQADLSQQRAVIGTHIKAIVIDPATKHGQRSPDFHRVTVAWAAGYEENLGDTYDTQAAWDD